MDNKKKISSALIIIIVTIIFIFLFYKLTGNKYVVDEIGYTNNIPFGAITKENSLKQYHSFEHAVTLSDIDIFLATYNNKNTCDVEFTLYKNDNEIYHHIINAENIKDNQYYTLSNINQLYQAEDVLSLVITSPNGTPGNAITVWMNSKDNQDTTFVYDSNSGNMSQYNGISCIKFYEKKNLDWKELLLVSCISFLSVIVTYEVLPRKNTVGLNS